ncbi:beta-phosphoglucomutase family hydrolase [Guggenheimella bovis]
MAYRAVLLSLAGILAHTQDAHFMAWKKVAKEIGFDLPQNLYEPLKGVPRLRALEMVLASQGLEDSFSLDQKHDLAFKKKMYYHELTKDFGPKQVLDGVEEVLTNLQNLGIKTGLVSGSQTARQLLEQMKLDRFFDAYPDLSKIGHGKPAPDIYLQVAKKLYVEPEECICFDDGQVGILGAKSAGMYAIGIGESHTFQSADAVFPSLDASKHYLYSLL